MTESEFLRVAEAVLDRIEDRIDALDDDLECTRSGNVLRIESDSGDTVVVNLQQPMREVWLAARSGAHHYRLDEASGLWQDTRGGASLFDALSRVLGEAVGHAITIDAG